jgi:hypothetical protein
MGTRSFEAEASENVGAPAAGVERMKQPHTESTVQHTETQQNTGNHKKPGAPDEHGADRFGGTRAGAENIEKEPSRKEGTEK